MFRSFDIFKMEPGGKVLWQGDQQTMVMARQFVEKINSSSPADYLILNQITGERMVVVQSESNSVSVKSC